ncbi:MAG: hypothetical protein ACI9YL_002010 [Luteibaculaceae bacterium]
MQALPSVRLKKIRFFVGIAMMKKTYLFVLLLGFGLCISCGKEIDLGKDYLLDPEFEVLLRYKPGFQWIYSNSDTSIFDTLTLLQTQRGVQAINNGEIGTIQSATLIFNSSRQGITQWHGKARGPGQNFCLVQEFNERDTSNLFFTQKNVGAQVASLIMSFKGEDIFINNIKFSDVRRFEDISNTQSVKGTLYTPAYGVVQKITKDTVWTIFDFNFSNEQNEGFPGL